MMDIDSADFTNDERVEACTWVEYSVGWPAREIRHTFTVEPALPGSVKLTFDRYLYDADGKMRLAENELVVGDAVVVVNGCIVEPFTIYASARLGWLQRYLERTGAVLA